MNKVTCHPCGLAHFYDADGDLRPVYEFVNEHAYCRLAGEPFTQTHIDSLLAEITLGDAVNEPA